MTGGLSQRGHLSPPTIFLTMWFWHSSSEKWVQCNNRCSPWIWQAPVTMWLPRLGHKRQHSFYLFLLRCLFLENSHHQAVKIFKLTYLCGEMGVSVFWGTAKTHQETWVKKSPASRSQQQVSTRFQLLLAKAQTCHPHTDHLNSDRTPSIIKWVFYITFRGACYMTKANQKKHPFLAH